MVSLYKYTARRKGEDALVHREIAEKAIGRKLPSGAQVHHVDGNGHNNSNANLVICPSISYHLMIHARTRAYEACGHAGWRQCRFCKQWDNPKNLQIYEYPKLGTNMVCHSECSKKHQQLRRNKKKLI